MDDLTSEDKGDGANPSIETEAPASAEAPVEDSKDPSKKGTTPDVVESTQTTDQS